MRRLAVVALLFLTACAQNPAPNGNPTPPQQNPDITLALSLVNALCPGSANPVQIATTCLPYIAQPGKFLSCACGPVATPAPATPTATQTTAPVATPTVAPTVAATPTPTQAPVAQITPVPAPTGKVPCGKGSCWVTTCSFPVPQPAPDNCTKTQPGQSCKNRDITVLAQAQVAKLYPQLIHDVTFPMPLGPCPTNKYVAAADMGTYDWNVALQALQVYPFPLCGAFNGENVALKQTSDQEDQFHVLRSDGCVLDPQSLYVFYCNPATF